jgi:hypothetical protein
MHLILRQQAPGKVIFYEIKYSVESKAVKRGYRNDSSSVKQSMAVLLFVAPRPLNLGQIPKFHAEVNLSKVEGGYLHWDQPPKFAWVELPSTAISNLFIVTC